jgi:hypothetical protein
MPIAYDKVNRGPHAAIILPVASVLFAFFGIGPSFFHALLAFCVLTIGVYLLWRPGEAQVFLYVFIYQWLQASLLIGRSNATGVPLDQIYPRFPHLDSAVAFALIGTLTLALGMRLGAGPQQASYISRSAYLISSIQPRRWLLLHIAVLLLSTACTFLAQMVPGLSQPLLALAGFKWATFFMLTLVTFSRPDASRISWFILFGLELILSLGGYFSSFRTVFLYTLIAISATSVRLTIGRIVLGGLTFFTMIILGIYWTAIKPEYREYVSGGQRQQIVVVDRIDVVPKIAELVSKVSEEQFWIGARQMMDRISELDMFSAVLAYVPSQVSHQWGGLWLDAISRPFMPRILFPNKEIIDESALTRMYTGMQISGIEQGTQISMGFLAEAYIDFSEIGMWGCLLLYGYFVGRIYRWCTYNPKGFGIIGAGLSSVMVLHSSSLGTSSTKMVGGTIVALLVAIILVKFVNQHVVSWLKRE